MIARHPLYLLEIFKTVRRRTRIAKSVEMIDVDFPTGDLILDPGDGTVSPAAAEVKAEAPGGPGAAVPSPGGGTDKEYIPLPVPPLTRKEKKVQIRYARRPIPL
jgi:hypothetical protein